ncbi:MAG: hypothetical protein ABIO69_02225 [Sphingomicrobium sp.]|jgi:uncharacterized membrane protein YkoI
MTMFRALFAAALGVSLIATPALAERSHDQRRDDQRRAAQARDQQRDEQTRDQARDQDRAFEATRQGRSMPLPNIERKVMPFMDGADYLGPELNGDTYRLKFMRSGRVIWVDVDAATGRILRRSKP